MAQASNKQMVLLRWLGIDLPQPQTWENVTWQAKDGWSETVVKHIIDYIVNGNGAGPGSDAWERLVFYRMARRLYEGRWVVDSLDEDQELCLVLQIVPKPRGFVLREAEDDEISPHQVCPFWCEAVDHNAMAFKPISSLDLNDCRLASPDQLANIQNEAPPKRIELKWFGLHSVKEMLFTTLRAMTEEWVFRRGDILPSPQDLAADQAVLFNICCLNDPDLAELFRPLSPEDIADVYDKSHYVCQEGDDHIIVPRPIIVYAT